MGEVPKPGDYHHGTTKMHQEWKIENTSENRLGVWLKTGRLVGGLEKNHLDTHTFFPKKETGE